MKRWVIGIMVLVLLAAIVLSVLWVRRMMAAVRVAYSNEQLELSANALDEFRRERGCYPTTNEFARMAELGYWTEGFASDTWGRPFIYEVGDCDRFTLTFLGRDGRAGGTGFDSDVVVTEKSRVPASARP